MADESGVIDAQRRFWEALKAKDAAQFEAILATDFVSIAPDEPDESRERFIATLTSFPGAVLSVDARQVRVDFFGETAVLTGTQIAEVRLPNGMEIQDVIAITNVFRNEGGEWKMSLARPMQMKL